MDVALSGLLRTADMEFTDRYEEHPRTNPLSQRFSHKLQESRIAYGLATLRIMNIEIGIVHMADRFVVGTRFKMSELGSLRCPHLAHEVGSVVEVSLRTTGVTVLFDGAARPTVLHSEYITPLSE